MVQISLWILLLVYADDVNILGGSLRTTKEKKNKASIVASKEI